MEDLERGRIRRGDTAGYRQRSPAPIFLLTAYGLLLNAQNSPVTAPVSVFTSMRR